MTTWRHDSRQDEASKIQSLDDLAGCVGARQEVTMGVAWQSDNYPTSLMPGLSREPLFASTGALNKSKTALENTTTKFKTFQLIRQRRQKDYKQFSTPKNTDRENVSSL